MFGVQVSGFRKSVPKIGKQMKRKAIIIAVMIFACVIWRWHYTSFYGSYAARFHGVDSFAGSWGITLTFGRNGTGTLREQNGNIVPFIFQRNGGNVTIDFSQSYPEHWKRDRYLFRKENHSLVPMGRILTTGKTTDDASDGYNSCLGKPYRKRII